MPKKTTMVTVMFSSPRRWARVRAVDRAADTSFPNRARSRSSWVKACTVWIAFRLSSAKAQSIYAEIVGEYPVQPGADPSELVKSFGDFERDDTSLQAIGEARPAALKIVERIDFDG